jgi:hypothetical protein
MRLSRVVHRHGTPTGKETDVTAVAEKRKYHNPSPIWVGINIFDAEGKRTSIQVEPGGYAWLSAEEAKMTAEAPVKPEDNPFVKTWQRRTGMDPNTGEPITVTETGLLVLTDDPPRPVGSERFIPGQEQIVPAPEADGPVGEPQPSEEPPHTGAAPTPSAPPEQGERAEDEVVATPEAVAANDAAKEAREGPTPAPTPPPRAPIPGA